MSRSAWLGLCVALVLVSFAGFLLSRKLERVTESEEVGYSGAARLNPYLALERVAPEMDLQATVHHSSLTLPSPPGALVLVADQRRSSPRNVQQILDWVSDGGLLVVAPPHRTDPDPLLEALGVRVLASSEDDAPREASPEPAPGDQLEPEDLRWLFTGPAERVQLPSGLTVRTGPRRLRLDTDTDEETSPAVVLGIPYGSGHVWAISDTGLWRNRRLDEEDHARLFFSLLAAPIPATGFTVVYRQRVASLASLLARHAWPVLLSGLVLVLALLATVGRRFGPALPDPPPHRRRLLEHIEASGAYLHRQGQDDLLIAASREALLRQARGHGLRRDMSRRQQARRLAELSGRPMAEVLAALSNDENYSSAELLSTLQSLESLRRSL